EAQFGGAGIAALLQFEEAATLSFVGPAADRPEDLGMFLRSEMQTASDGLEQPAAAALGKISWQKRLEGPRHDSGGGDFDQSFMTNDEVRWAIDFDSFCFTPLPEFAQNAQGRLGEQMAAFDAPD